MSSIPLSHAELCCHLQCLCLYSPPLGCYKIVIWVDVLDWRCQRSAGVIAVIQVLSRYWALWGIVEVAPEAAKHGALKLFTVGDVTLQLNLITLLFCWSLTEILRYGFYAAKVG